MIRATCDGPYCLNESPVYEGEIPLTWMSVEMSVENLGMKPTYEVCSWSCLRALAESMTTSSR